MKLYALALFLIIGGIPSIFRPGSSAAGIICTIVGFLIIACKISSSSITRTQSNHSATVPYEISNDDCNEWQKKHDEYDKILKKWHVVFDEHQMLSEQIGVAYTIANNLSLPDSPEMHRVIELCKKDIALAEMFKRACIERDEAAIKAGYYSKDDIGRALPSFPTFKRLAIIYEKQKRYDEAIAVCERAIELGFINDGTEGQMPGRIARLMKKKGNKFIKIENSGQIIVNDNVE